MKQHPAHLALLPILLSYQCRKAKQNKAAKCISSQHKFCKQQSIDPRNWPLNREKELKEKIDILTVLYTSHWTAFGSERNSDLNKSQFLTVVRDAKSYKLSTLQSAAMFTSVSSSNSASHENLLVYRKLEGRSRETETSGLETGAKIKFVRHYWKCTRKTSLKLFGQFTRTNGKLKLYFVGSLILSS